ncbi:MAG: hypothetical protein GX882_00785 [Methanomicrobiales archaeon]|nr:hypothetical protein [Methanomicrobiales archaeon]
MPAAWEDPAAAGEAWSRDCRIPGSDGSGHTVIGRVSARAASIGPAGDRSAISYPRPPPGERRQIR